VALSLTETKPVSITLTDLQGRQLSNLHQGYLSAGRHEFRWDGTRFDGQPVTNGVYLVHIRTEDDSHVVKLTLQR
jgi:flagellar hook assembly protein FlgD